MIGPLEQTEKKARWVELTLTMLKIGLFTFGGGWSIVAQMQKEFVEKRGWLTAEELLDIVAMGRSFPGIMVVNTSVGMLTPPMALNILIAAGIGHDPIERISKKVVPFLLVLILDILVITYVPGFVTFLPRLLGMI